MLELVYERSSWSSSNNLRLTSNSGPFFFPLPISDPLATPCQAIFANFFGDFFVQKISPKPPKISFFSGSWKPPKATKHKNKEMMGRRPQKRAFLNFFPKIDYFNPNSPKIEKNSSRGIFCRKCDSFWKFDPSGWECCKKSSETKKIFPLPPFAKICQHSLH